MEIKDELKEIDIKNSTCYHDGDIIRVKDILFYDFFYKKSYKTYNNILIYHILYKHFILSKPLRLRSNKINRFINIFYAIRY